MYYSSMILLLPAFLLAIWARYAVKGNYNKYKQIKNAVGMTGAEIARSILDREGLNYVNVECINGNLTDNYNPAKETVFLSQDIFYGSSISSMAIAAHECGHAIQHARSYSPLRFRNAIFPVAKLGSEAAFPLFFIGLIFSATSLIKLGIVFFAISLIFQVVTLPVEFNASSRALKQISNGFISSEKELIGAKKVLWAAAMTYVASALMALTQLIRMFIIGRDRD